MPPADADWVPSTPEDRAKGTHIVLVGLMGSGKSSLGRELSRRLGRPLFDSDELVERRTGRTVREIWRAEGEAAFRVLETEALTDALASTTPSVIAAAGGVVLSAANREALRHSGARVIWLRATPDVLAGRVGAQDHRPLLDDDPLARLRQMATDREALYAEVATDTVDSDAHNVSEMVELVLAGVPR